MKTMYGIKPEERVQALNDLAIETYENGKDDKLSFLIPGVAKLDSMLLDCEQFDDIDSDGEAVLVERVVRVKRFVSRDELNWKGLDYVSAAGLYIVVPMYLLPAKKVRRAMNKRRGGWIQNPVAHGLPSLDEVDYATLKPLSGTCYTALAKMGDGYINGIISTARNYDNVGF